ncbi:organic radical activating enzyme [Zymomonas mobilis subsp. mobilis ZM4 = ATCC 31821]|uniref:7-carboxy-7-deazaguanine synthase n=1 Tax=Zymomonas mobilis subsp. mobilis (strain ATCC 31821 / ZM4 / CP4) TaxID=264203 RepID=Q5NMZ1_ZYMMO|nr:7-carboxy-7-deazaguanine synthase [Zymomonas mobilis]AAV89919.1 organic radical activating-like protein [Zymomonas mobilis subsp. mobilis ZM4 = ATCC 31821]AVZ26163.1 organic radical activating enzyme [Zymomonas mobilis subsp. mobilis]AVZ28050.1 organic radical activating enzyme [Zymomonas mobilis subsp. mobilis]AVZ42495.1 organic radical activating enzyme [Zymomonas mobilis subsp. mobilis ZM4 = ATCC 31821]UBQ07265.1 7-carboxy-7-deazaguanine synthase [Zymomonas mobilis]
MSRHYAVKESFLTLQGEGIQAGRRAVFIRFAGCNLWNGREDDREQATCRFCDTDFVGIDGENGGRFTAEELAEQAIRLWKEAIESRYQSVRPFVVLTGGEPLLQVDEALLLALKNQAFEIAIETNGTQPVPSAIDWVCMSPKAGSQIILEKGNEIKLVWPQKGIDIEALEKLDFDHYLIQPMDDEYQKENIQKAIAFVMQRPLWRLSIQSHKLIGVK